MQKKKALLILEDGEILSGYSFGAEGSALGEVVFNTGMTGYQEVLTDPSYYGQIVMQTYPMIGNYGINLEDMESKKIHMRGYIAREICFEPSNFRSKMTLHEYLKGENIVGIWSLNTRDLTKKLREKGVLNGLITTELTEEEALFCLDEIKSYQIKDAIMRVTGKEIKTYSAAENSCFRVALLDYGYKKNLVRSLVLRGCEVTVFPAGTPAGEILKKNPDGILLSNGPGDPEEDRSVIENVKKLIESRVPVLGVCLGHQLAALALGGRTEKLKYGHRGSNQPVFDRALGRTFVTSQNHGYTVVEESLGKDVGEVSHVNANDGTIEGIKYKVYPCFTAQFHPEASAGPNDTSYLFDSFMDLMRGGKQDA